LERILLTPAREYVIGSESPAPPEGQGYSEFMIPLLHPLPASLLEYLPRASLILIDDWQAAADAVAEVETQALQLRQDSIREGTLAQDFPIPYLTWDDLQDSFASQRLVDLGQPTSDALAEVVEAGPPALAEQFQAGPRFAGRLKDVMDYLGAHYLAGEQLVIVSRQTGRLTELWAEQALERDTPEVAAPIFIEGSLGEGWVFTPPYGRPANLLTDGEIFGWRRPEPRRRARPAAETPEAGYADLEVMTGWCMSIRHRGVTPGWWRDGMASNANICVWNTPTKLSFSCPSTRPTA
jgi:transcription-repair coupling factor (superfamily II helicase)